MFTKVLEGQFWGPGTTTRANLGGLHHLYPMWPKNCVSDIVSLAIFLVIFRILLDWDMIGRFLCRSVLNI